MSRQVPKYDNSVAWRAIAVITVFVWPFAAVASVVWYGVPVLWTDWPKAVRATVKTLWTGKPGPWDGCVW